MTSTANIEMQLENLNERKERLVDYYLFGMIILAYAGPFAIGHYFFSDLVPMDILTKICVIIAFLNAIIISILYFLFGKRIDRQISDIRSLKDLK